ncbi:hypothetical protein F975_00099 [Acinetobacter sp. ANC 3789]|nr:hypothetical protein F975_00099 [Acinetobacter sp. ANC 3789]
MISADCQIQALKIDILHKLQSQEDLELLKDMLFKKMEIQST